MARVDLTRVHTNIVYIDMLQMDIMNAHQFVNRMATVSNSLDLDCLNTLWMHCNDSVSDRKKQLPFIY